MFCEVLGLMLMFDVHVNPFLVTGIYSHTKELFRDTFYLQISLLLIIRLENSSFVAEVGRNSIVLSC